MFKSFSRYFVLTMLLLPSMVSAADYCVAEFKDVETLFNMYETECSENGKICECLKAQDNVFIKTRFADQSDLNISKEDFKKTQTARLLNVYKDMTYGAAYQKSAFNLEEEKVIGCTPEQLEKDFKNAVKTHMSEELFTRQSNIVSESLGCKTPDACNKLKNDLSKITAEIEVVDKQVLDACTNLAKVMKDVNKEKELVKDLEKVLEWYTSNKAPESKLKEIRDAIVSVRGKSPAKKTVVTLYTDSEFVFANKPKGLKEQINNFEACDASSMDSPYSVVMSGYKQDLTNVETNLKMNLEPIKSISNDIQNPNIDLLAEIKNFNEKVQHDFVEKYDKVGPDSCYTFSEYKILQSRPSPDLIKAINEASENSISNFFKPSGHLTSKLEMEKMKFLRANPAIANTLSVDCANVELPHLMKRFAGLVNGKSPEEQMTAYLDFMQKDVKKLLGETEVKIGAVDNCNTLARNFAAVMMTDEPAPVPVYKTDNPMEMLNQQILTCKTTEANALSTNNIAHTLASNPLYIIQGDIDPELRDKEDQDDYKKFLNANCGGFAQKREAAIKKNCSIPEAFLECQKKFDVAGSKESMDLRQQFFNQKARGQAAGPRNVIAQRGRSTFTRNDHQLAASINSEQSQDTAVRNHYEQTVRPNMSNSILANKGEEASYTQAVSSHNKVIASSAAIPIGTQAAPTVAEVDWNKPYYPSVTSEMITSPEVANFVPSTYSVQTTSEKIETLKVAKENLVTEGPKLVNGAKNSNDKQKIVNDLRKSLSKMDEEVQKIEALSKVNNKVLTPLPNYVAGNDQRVANEQTFMTSSGSESGSFAGSASSQSQAAGSFKKVSVSSQEKMNNAYLNSKYKNDEVKTGQNRGPASEGLSLIIGPSLTTPVAATAELLSKIPMDSKSFADRDLVMEKVKSELEKNKVKKTENVLIQFFDKTKNEVLIVSVAWVNNQWVVSQVPRKTMLSNLKLTLISQTIQ